jgi:hypothetical protein
MDFGIIDIPGVGDDEFVYDFHLHKRARMDHDDGDHA